jgi:hypothetical protein
MKAMRGTFIDHLLELGCIGARWIITERRESMFEAFSDCTADMFALHVKQCRVLISPNRKPLIQRNHDLLLFGCVLVSKGWRSTGMSASYRGHAVTH